MGTATTQKISINIEWDRSDYLCEGCLIHSDGDIDQDASINITPNIRGIKPITYKGEFDGYDDVVMEGFDIEFKGIFAALGTVKSNGTEWDYVQEFAEEMAITYLEKYISVG